MRVAAVDCGTNSIRLLVADVEAGGTLTDVVRQMRVVRLGEGVDRTGVLSEAALARTFAACEEYAALVASTGARALRFVATSASRDARNRDVFVAGVRERLGVEPEVVSGAEEASLSFAGATRELAGDGGSPWCVTDIGGGSTELVLGSGSVEAARSVDVGCVRLTERHLHDDPPTPAQVAAARADTGAALDLVEEVVPVRTARTLVGVAGSVTTVAARALGLDGYRPEAIHRARIAADQVREACEDLLGMSHAERAALPYMHPGRVDVIGAGALVLHAVLDRVGTDELVVSEHDILDGIAWSVLDRA